MKPFIGVCARDNPNCLHLSVEGNSEPVRLAAEGGIPNKMAARRDGRVVDGGGLENHCTRKGTGGSNPSPSAKSLGKLVLSFGPTPFPRHKGLCRPATLWYQYDTIE
jgi:hypothetical protein